MIELEKKIFSSSYPAGLVMGGGLVMVQFLGTLGLFSMEAMGFFGSKSNVLWWCPLAAKK